jgi:hypothetical protein
MKICSDPARGGAINGRAITEWNTMFTAMIRAAA